VRQAPGKGLLSFGAGSTASAATQAAEPKNVVMTFGDEPSTGMNFTWSTPAGTTAAGFVEYSQKSSFTGFGTANIKSQKATSLETSTDAGKRIINKVSLSGLEPATEYVYRVGSTSGYSQQGTFRTDGKPADGLDAETFTFINITDTQGDTSGDYAIWKNTLDKALSKFPNARFLVHTGDFVDNGQKMSQWNMALGAVKNELLNLPIAPSVGNHEMLNQNNTNTNAKNYTDSFNLPAESDTGAPSGTVYSFDYGNAHIAVMNTQCGSKNLGKQAEWLKKDMKASNKTWKIVALHRGPYGATYDTTDIRDAWTPAFDEVGVDLVLQGHDHNYIRSHFMRDEKITDVSKGTLYITGNSGGVKFYPVKARNWQAVDLQPKTQMYVAVTISASKLQLQSYDVKDNLRDSITMEKFAEKILSCN
ncbi:MAG: metallophosphoesterase family protein, partial [Clostridiales bacterium]|nr:metallophosphoesterase family protein [Clostridiales bacterium]